MTEQTEQRKEQMLTALEKSLGVVSSACKSANVGRTQFYSWLKSDNEFKAKVRELESIALDFAESHLHKLIQEGNPQATIFFLKTKGKRRGYVEKQEIEIIEKKPLSWMDDVVKREGIKKTSLTD